MNWITKPLVVLNSSKAMKPIETSKAIKKFMAAEVVGVSIDTDDALNMSDIQKRAIVSEDVLHKLKTIYSNVKVKEIEDNDDHASDKNEKNVKPSKKQRKSLS